MRVSIIYLSLFLFAVSCKGQTATESKSENVILSTKKNELILFLENYKESKASSKSQGTVSKGKLVNGKLMPFSGKNFNYFDTASYVNGRAFVHEKVRSSVVKAYEQLEKTIPDRHFCIMECSHEKGGKLFPHRTHQNGLSIDFMVPLLKNDLPCYELDQLGANHYWIDFNSRGKYTKDEQIVIDFNTMAAHILELDDAARKEGVKIKKVLFKIELKEQLFATENGKKLKKRGIYFAQKLEPIINQLHDDHYHIDFELVK